jgi:fumarylacetoacetate (FAA) hydrolase family protein
VRRINVDLTVRGPDGFELTGASSMAEIARDPEALVREMMGPVHQYPDGAMLFLGTMFAPVEDRDAPGMGFTHRVGDIATVHAPELGSLTNRMTLSSEAPPWDFGVGHLMRNLARRGVL